MAIISGCQNRGRETEYKPRFPGGRWDIWLCRDVRTEELLVTRDPVALGPLTPPLASKPPGKSLPWNPRCLTRANYFVPGEFKWQHTCACEYFRQGDTIDEPFTSSASSWSGRKWNRNISLPGAPLAGSHIGQTVDTTGIDPSSEASSTNELGRIVRTG